MNATATGLQEDGVNTTAGTVTGSYDDIFTDTPNLKKEATPDRLNQARVSGVTREETNSGLTFIKVHLQLVDEGKDTDMGIFPPAEFVANTKVDPTTLSSEKTISEKSGKDVPSVQSKYAQVVRNTAGDATLQTLGNIIKEAGNSIGEVSDFDSLVAGLNSGLQGVDVYVKRTVDKNPNDPQFANVLRTRQIFPNTIDVNSKRFAHLYKPFQQ